MRKWFQKATAAALACSMVAGGAFTGITPSNVLAADPADAQWQQIQDVVGRYYGEWKDTSYTGAITTKLPTTALLGNGDVGITSGGNDSSKTFYVSKSDFWTYGTGSYSSPCPPLPIGGITIEKGKKEAAVEEAENIAPTYKNVSVSSYHDSFTADKAVNGEFQKDPNGYGWVSKRPQDPEQNGAKEFWLQLEYEEPIDIARYVLKNDGAVRAGVSKNNTSDFQVQVSDDGTEWTTVDTVTGNTADEVDHNLETPVSAKFVRLLITKATQETDDDSRKNPRARVGQFELYSEAKQGGGEVEEESANLALNKPVQVSSYNEGFQTGDMLVDGNIGTKWCAVPAKQDGSKIYWAMIDLGEEKDIARWVLKNAQAGGEGANYNTRDFSLQYSTKENPDPAVDADWVDVDVVEGNTKAITDRNLQEPIKARYVRLHITKPETQGNDAVRIYEMELYSEPAPESADFYEKQDILNAEIQTTQQLADVPTEMKTWLSDDKNIMVTELTSKGEEDAYFQVGTWATNNDKANKPITAENDADSVTITRSTPNTDKNPENKKAHISKAALSTKIIGADDVVASSSDANGKGTLKFTLEAGETVYIVTAIGGGGRTYHNDGSMWEGAVDPIEDAKAVLAEVKDETTVEDINADRQEWWKDFWSASYVDFGTEDENLNKVQKYYYGAQYILGSTAKEGELAPGLYGIWHTQDGASWSSDYHLNYNFIATFYGTNASNRPEIALPAVQALLDYVPEGQRRATSTEELKRIRRDFVEEKVAKGDIDPVNGIEGAILFPVGIAPWGMTTDNVYLNEALDAAYNSYTMSQYYAYTLDEDFMDAGAYDFMKQAVTFYESWLEKEENPEAKDGYEYVLYAGYNEGSWAKNPGVELAALKNTLRNLIKASEDMNKDADRRENWIDIYEHLGDQPTTVVNGKKVLALGEKQWNGSAWVDLSSPIPGDGNAIPLDAVIPGGVYNYFSAPEDLQMVRDTVSVFSDRGAWSQINNFPRLFPEAVKARYDIDTVVTKLCNVIDRQMAANLRINDGVHGVEKCGSTETINGMLIQSDNGMTKIFPNWYADKDAKFANLRAKDAFTLSAEYDGAAQEAKNVSVTSEKGKTMTLVSPWAEGAHVLDSEGNIVEVTTGTVPNWEDTENMTITFDTVAGETYTVEKGLVEKEEVDKEWLSALIDYAHSQQEQEEYQYLVPAVKVPFEKALEEAIAVNEKANATQAEVDAAYDKLLDMVHYLGFTGNSDSLKVLADSARGLNPDLFTEETWAVLEDALAKADAVLANENALQAEIDVARDVLQDAIDGLVRIPVDKDALKKLIDKSQKYVDKIDQYTDGTAKIFTDVLAEAVATYENADASQKDVDAAYTALQNAIFQLRLKPNKDKLDDLIKAAEKVDTSKYTEESAAAFKAALDDAKAVFADSEATKEEVKAAEKALKEAQKNLVAKADADTDKKDNDKVASNDDNKDNKDDKAPVKTGDTASVWTMLLGCMAAVAAAGTVVMKRKRR